VISKEGRPSSAIPNATKASKVSEKIVDNRDEGRFELTVGSELATTHYSLEQGVCILHRTDLPASMMGRGYGNRLATGVFELLKARGLKVEARCSYQAAFAAWHPEYDAMLVD